MISGKAKLAGVIGWPINHSLSPALHNAWIEIYGIDGAYVPLAVKPENFERAIKSLPLFGFRGVNITIPHKESAAAIIDHLDEIAHRVGAVNTVTIGDDGILCGSNTDVFGFMENLRSAGFRMGNNKIAAVLGAGGGARAVIVALQEMGFEEIRIFNRTVERAERCVSELSCSGKGVLKAREWSRIEESLDNVFLLVNATSSGMKGQNHLDISLKKLPQDSWVTDIVYNPLITVLLDKARKNGHRIVDGLGMLLHQARPGFKSWFGVEPEVTQELRETMLAKL